MFVLRQITKDGQVSNLNLGDRYTYIDKENSIEAFNASVGRANSHPDQEKIFGLIAHENSSDIYPLYKGFNYYVMTDCGKTFENLTRRD